MQTHDGVCRTKGEKKSKSKTAKRVYYVKGKHNRASGGKDLQSSAECKPKCCNAAHSAWIKSFTRKQKNKWFWRQSDVQAAWMLNAGCLSTPTWDNLGLSAWQFITALITSSWNAYRLFTHQELLENSLRGYELSNYLWTYLSSDHYLHLFTFHCLHQRVSFFCH